ncbi:MAG: ATP-dependent zinc metalloprotease FtsH 2 [Chroococcidiopsis cubana SAG 39.79]|uniref:Peptidase M41 domain-containing protein n=1 Tax=Chroococcidiopsis cubana SAG 39.79 TaxID=388085 RepID=A0AB37U757_9CYAN|nr:hypothetical protein [Chroococcidiopsis cubana]MDZ4877305.1 ATP-dependent zinc metalloprotease FtsH 2 [Chroococcidiopsis cubana SAG 39.79]RUS92368.1 hypothetical protein DSM107010_73150 [Chroococcidiopsis cubana SAG 39.79]
MPCAIDRITIGLPLASSLDGWQKRLTAYHEIGHAILMTLLENAAPLNRVSIIPRSSGLAGFAQTIPDEENVDSDSLSRAWILDNITYTLGGRAAEVEIFGSAEVATGVKSDLERATYLARQMVRYGMSDFRNVVLEPTEYFSAEYSVEMGNKIDREVRAILESCYQRARTIIREYRALIDRLVDVLIEQETIEGEQFRQLVEEYHRSITKTVISNG